MVVLITGATGNVGRALARVLRREGAQVVAAVRDVELARNALGPEIELVELHDASAMREAVERADAIVNLAGAPIAERRWSKRQKRELRASRVELTGRLSDYVRAAHNPPCVLVSASATGIYPDRGDAAQDESSPRAVDFLGELCGDWEAAARHCQSARTRVVSLRISVVLDAESGALAKLLPLFRLGLGGPLGGGQQYFSWIHLDDLLAIILFALRDDALRGPVNATAPTAVTNRELTRGLAELVGRPAPLPVPALAVRLAMGGRAALMLSSQRIVPRVLERAGYQFLYPTLESALAEIAFRQEESVLIGRHGAPDAREEPDGATHVLTQVTELRAPLSEVFAFFARAQNLAWITPPWMGFRIVGAAPSAIAEGTRIEYDIRLGPLPIRWRTRIARFEPGELFVDQQERGPYRLWWHEHSFEELEEETRMVDRVFIRLPFGSAGQWLAGRVVHAMLRRIFAYRAQAMAHRFGRPALHAPAPVRYRARALSQSA